MIAVCLFASLVAAVLPLMAAEARPNVLLIVYDSFASGKIFHTGVIDKPSWDTDIAEVSLTPPIPATDSTVKHPLQTAQVCTPIV